VLPIVARPYINLQNGYNKCMSTWNKINGIWKNVQEVDLRPIRKAAERRVKMAIFGETGSGKRALAAQLAMDPWRPSTRGQPPVTLADLDSPQQAEGVDLIVLMADPQARDLSRARQLSARWASAGKTVIVFFLQPQEGYSPDEAPATWGDWGTTLFYYGSPDDTDQLLETFAPLMMAALPEDHLAWGRQFPLLRPPVAQKLINDTAFSNAVYSLSTGVAEIVPGLGIPLNIADMVVLTKAQALLVYRLGLILGLPTDWKYYLGEFSSVVGGGFLWRQLARSLVGLIPIWGIIPKVAVAYAGTYTVGQVVLRWYQTGRHLNRKEMQAIYRMALEQGRTIARTMADKVPRPRLRLRRRGRDRLPPSSDGLMCPHCGTRNEPDANYCKACGQVLTQVT
jgi:uncharacterized protein (DUF697 family)